jgi:hypothetical protein
VQTKDVEQSALREYVVAAREGEWTITLVDNVIGAYRSEQEAMRGAIEAARDAGVRGYRAEVLVRERGNFLRSAWTFGLDPFPPPASGE